MDDYFEYKIVSGEFDDEEKDRKKEDKDKNSTTEEYENTRIEYERVEKEEGPLKLEAMLFDQISNDIKEAMKARDKVRLETLRNVKKVFLEAKTAPGANDELSDEAALKIIQKLAKQGRDAASIYEGQGRADLAADELAQVSVLEGYMPKQMSAEELKAALTEIIAQVGAAGPQDMGKVMGVATKQLAGRAEGRAISACVKELLAK